MKSATTLDPIWEEKYSDGLKVKYPYDSVVTFVFRNRPRNLDIADTKVLEVGCGTGNNIWFLAREGFQAFGLDGSTSAIEAAREILALEGLSAQLKVGDFTSLPYEDECFDLVIDRGSITCCGFSAAAKTIDEIRRCLKPGGKFFFNPYSDMHSSFASGNLTDDGVVKDITAGTMTGVGQICFYGKRQAMALLSNGWDIETIEHMVQSDVTKAETTHHAEWRIIAKKL